MKKRILFVHQSAELYGSDRVLFELVSKIDKQKFVPIVVLPENGPLVTKLRAENIDCRVLPVSKISRSSFRATKIIKLPYELYLTCNAITKSLHGQTIDLVYSNTLAVLSGAVWSLVKRVPHVWHVHEIVQRPKLVRTLFSVLLYTLAGKVICISRAVENNLIKGFAPVAKKTTIISNGFERRRAASMSKALAFRKSLKCKEDDVLVALVGRVNTWKGQKDLLKALEVLWHQGKRNIHGVMIGGAVPGKEELLFNLREEIRLSPLENRISLLPFSEDVWAIWDSCDIAVVPSTEPEPFGMVALEAMSASKPVIGAGHGGLTEIIDDGQTGFLFCPRDVSDLAEKIGKLAQNRQMRLSMGARGKERLKQRFSHAVFIDNVERALEGVMVEKWL